MLFVFFQQDIFFLLLLHVLSVLFPLSFINSVFLQISQCTIIDFVVQKNAQLLGITAESAHDQATEYPSDAHVVMERSQKCTMESLFEEGLGTMHSLISMQWMATSGDFPRLLALELHSIELQHHDIGCLVSFGNFNIVLELLRLLQTQWVSQTVESGLKCVGEQPLNEPVMFLQLIKISPPFLMNVVDQIPIRLGYPFVQVKLHIRLQLLFLLHFYFLFFISCFLTFTSTDNQVQFLSTEGILFFHYFTFCFHFPLDVLSLSSLQFIRRGMAWLSSFFLQAIKELRNRCLPGGFHWIGLIYSLIIVRV